MCKLQIHVCFIKTKVKHGKTTDHRNIDYSKMVSSLSRPKIVCMYHVPDYFSTMNQTADTYQGGSDVVHIKHRKEEASTYLGQHSRRDRNKSHSRLSNDDSDPQSCDTIHIYREPQEPTLLILVIL